MKCAHIEARDLPDAWFQTIYAVLEQGREFKIDHGSYAGSKRLEFDYVTINIANPCFGMPHDRLPKIPAHYNIPDPVNPDYVFGGKSHEGRPYVESVMTATKEKNESYTYGERLTEFPIQEAPLDIVWFGNARKDLGGDGRKIIHIEDELWENKQFIFEKTFPYRVCLNQIEYAIWRYRKSGHRNNQIVLQIAHPSDMLIQDPPCLRQIDTRIQDGVLHFIIYFRSWDLWGGFPANLAGLTYLMTYMADAMGVGRGSFVCSSKGLHIYKYVWELAEIIRGKTIEQFKEGK